MANGHTRSSSCPFIPCHSSSTLGPHQALLPPGIVAMILAGDGEAAVALLSQEVRRPPWPCFSATSSSPSLSQVETPEIIWDRAMAEAVASRVERLCCEARVALANRQPLPTPASEPPAAAFERLRSELCCGGVYVRLFLKDPGFPLRDPKLCVGQWKGWKWEHRASWKWREGP